MAPLKLAEKAAQQGRSVDKMLTDMLQQYAGNISAVARALGVSRPTIYNYLKYYRWRHAPESANGKEAETSWQA